MNGFYIFFWQHAFLDPDVNLETVPKLRQYGVLIGKDNSSLDTYVKSYKFLKFHAILFDASGNIAEQSERPRILICFALSNHKRLY